MLRHRRVRGVRRIDRAPPHLRRPPSPRDGRPVPIQFGRGEAAGAVAVRERAPSPSRPQLMAVLSSSVFAG
jgi:hypothetical protein